ncbi:MAG: DUF6786 family protein [Armatimonadota bacterium]
MSDYQALLDILDEQQVELADGSSRCAICPTLGGRVFAEVNGLSLHRIDLATVADPTRPFNNYGGGNFWPAPEGGLFGFNYTGDEWGVQPGINLQPFTVDQTTADAVSIQKRVNLTNRLGTVLDVSMARQVELVPLPSRLLSYRLAGSLTYLTTDTFTVHNAVSTDAALLAAWTLEQFSAADDTIAFGIVRHPEEAINFDFYPEHPGERITYYPGGFTYRTDGIGLGQIGIRQAAQPAFIGFYDFPRRVLCLREHLGSEGCYFNIADNVQPGGPYSAADSYSIFNSSVDMQAFELETVGSAVIANGMLTGSKLISMTTLAVVEDVTEIERFLADYLY